MQALWQTLCRHCAPLPCRAYGALRSSHALRCRPSHQASPRPAPPHPTPPAGAGASGARLCARAHHCPVCRLLPQEGGGKAAGAAAGAATRHSHPARTAGGRQRARCAQVARDFASPISSDGAPGCMRACRAGTPSAPCSICEWPARHAPICVPSQAAACTWPAGACWCAAPLSTRQRTAAPCCRPGRALWQRHLRPDRMAPAGSRAVGAAARRSRSCPLASAQRMQCI